MEREGQRRWPQWWAMITRTTGPAHGVGWRALALSGALVYLALAVAYGVVAPPFESPDEIGHFFTIKYITDYGSLPVPEKELSEQYLYGQESTQPPLYYDRLERRDGRWGIVERICMVESRDDNVAPTGFEGDGDYVTPRRDRDDASYMRPLKVDRSRFTG